VANLYSITANQAAIIALFRVINHYVGNLPPMPGVFPDYPALVVRDDGGGREMVTMRWGMPPPPGAAAVLDVRLGSVHRSGASGGFGRTILLCGSGRFGASTSKCSGLCGGSPSRHSRFALLRIAQRGRCNRLTICDTECVGHKVISSRSSSSVQRDI
jgi:hypothetical protein